MDGRNWLGLFEGCHSPLRQKHNAQGKRVGDETREVGRDIMEGLFGYSFDFEF